MDYIDKVQHVMDYIELNLADTISYEKIAQLACCSSYHFQRMFPFITGVTLSEYIRRRRLTLAAFELQTRKERVIDVALKYGYESPEAFTRAFKALHGITPTAARDINAALKAYPPMKIQLSIKGETEMNYRIVQREGFEVFGFHTEISTDQELAFQQVPEFFKKCDHEGITDSINSLLGRFHDNHTISAMYDFTDETFRYMLCNFLPKGLNLPPMFEILRVPPSTWAVFDVPNCEMQSMWQRIWSEWFPMSGYEMGSGVQFEMYYGLAKHENCFGEIWVPVMKVSSK